MPIQRYSSQNTANATITTTTETIIATISGVNTPRAGCKVHLVGFAQITTGTATTALTFRVRRGSTITDTVVAEANAEQIEAAAGSTEGHAVAFEDTPGEVAGQTYVLTVQQTAATGDGTAVFAEAWADVVS